MNLTATIGDTRNFSIPLRWRTGAFAPGEDWFLIFTVKESLDDTDEQAKIQKTTDLGITVQRSHAIVQIVPIDTAGDPEGDPIIPALIAGTYYWGIKAQKIADPTQVRTIATGELELEQPVGQGTETAVPVYVAEPPLRYDTQLVTYS